MTKSIRSSPVSAWSWSKAPSGLLGRGPARPAVLFIDDEACIAALQLGLAGPSRLQIVEIFEEQQPGGLLGVIELGSAAGLFPEDVVDILESLLEHGWALAFSLDPERPVGNRGLRRAHVVVGWRGSGVKVGGSVNAMGDAKRLACLPPP